MGSWSHEPFGNDTACDWSYDLEESEDLAFIEQTLDKVIATGSDYLEAPDAEEAIAAIEVIAKLLGRGTQTDSYTEAVDQWVSCMPHKPDSALLQKARSTLDRILSSESELLDLWKDSDSFGEWDASMKRLKVSLTP